MCVIRRQARPYWLECFTTLRQHLDKKKIDRPRCVNMIWHWLEMNYFCFYFRNRREDRSIFFLFNFSFSFECFYLNMTVLLNESHSAWHFPSALDTLSEICFSRILRNLSRICCPMATIGENCRDWFRFSVSFISGRRRGSGSVENQIGRSGGFGWGKIESATATATATITKCTAIFDDEWHIIWRSKFVCQSHWLCN